MAVNYYPNRFYDPTSQSFYINAAGVGQDSFLYNNCVIADGEIDFVNERGYLRTVAGGGVAPGAGKFYVYEGRAVIFGTISSISYTALSPESTAANHRYDAIVLKLDLAAKTVTPTIIQGVENAVPAFPAVTDTANDKYLLLSYVRLTHPFVKDTTGTADISIIDKRVFAETNESVRFYGADKNNLITNPEFAVYSAASGTATAGLPEGFYLVAGACVVSRELNSTGDSPRGFVCKFRGNTGGIISTQLDMPDIQPLLHSGVNMYFNDYTAVKSPITASVRMKLESGKAVTLRLKRGAQVIKETSFYYNATTSAWFNAVIRGYYDSIPVSVSEFSLEIEDITLATAAFIYINFVSATIGNIPISYSKKNELIMFKNSVPVTGYTSANTHSSGSTTFTSAGLGCTARDIKFLIFQARIWDTGSLANPVNIYFHSANNILSAQGSPNGHYEEDTLWVNVLANAVDDIATITRVASGANTLTIVLNVIGAIT